MAASSAFARARVRPTTAVQRVEHRAIDLVVWWRNMPLAWRLLPAFSFGAVVGMVYGWVG